MLFLAAPILMMPVGGVRVLVADGVGDVGGVITAGEQRRGVDPPKICRYGRRRGGPAPRPSSACAGCYAPRLVGQLADLGFRHGSWTRHTCSSSGSVAEIFCTTWGGVIPAGMEQ